MKQPVKTRPETSRKAEKKIIRLRKWCFHFPMGRSHPQGKIEQMNVNATCHGHTYPHARTHIYIYIFMESHTGNTGTENPGAEIIALRAYRFSYCNQRHVMGRRVTGCPFFLPHLFQIANNGLSRQ